MIHEDTIKLLRECDAGVKMGISSIEDVLDEIHDLRFKEILTTCKEKHKEIDQKLQTILDKYHDEGKEPTMMAKSMSWMETNMKLMMDDSDRKIADIMTDGSNMGVKSLSKYLNQYKAADEESKDITKKLIDLEEKLVQDIRCYL